MFPVFSLVLDQDVKPEMALLYPELYKDLTKVWMSLVLRLWTKTNAEIAVVQNWEFLQSFP